VDAKISVIIPVYKVEKYLEKCVDSVIAQTYRNLEIILVDDGSPDGCPEICDAYGRVDPRITVIHKQNGGLSSARNAGLDVATGEYIGFVDSDDHILPGTYERLYQALRQSEADVCLSGYTFVDEGGEKVPGISPCPIGDETLTREQAYAKLGGEAWFYYVTAVNRLYRREIFRSIRFPGKRLNEDEFIAHHVFSKCDRIACVSDCLYLYVQRSGSIMNAEFSIRRLDANWAFYDRYSFFRKDHGAFAHDAILKSYSLLLKYVPGLDLVRHKKAVAPLIRKTAGALLRCRDLRGMKLLLVYARGYAPARLLRAKFRAGFLLWVYRARAEKKPVVFLTATPVHGNLGDQAIAYAERQMLDRLGLSKTVVEIDNVNYLRNADWIAGKVKPQDAIVIDGGGNLGTLWPEEDDKIGEIIRRFSQNRIVVFPQTCYYKGDPERLKRNAGIYRGARDLTLFLRDRRSYDFMRENFPGLRCHLVPDVALSIRHGRAARPRNGVLLCLRRDRECIVGQGLAEEIKVLLASKHIDCFETTTVLDRSVTRRNREEAVFEKLWEFAGARLVITDRLHAMIFAAVTQTPCIAVDNESKKVMGTYEWLRGNPGILHLENASDITANILRMHDAPIPEFDFDYPADIIERAINGEGAAK